MSSLSPLTIMTVYQAVNGTETTGTVSTKTDDYKSVLDKADTNTDGVTTQDELAALKKSLTKNAFMYKLLDSILGPTMSAFLPESFTEKRDEYERNLNLVKVMIKNFDRFDAQKGQTGTDILHGVTAASVNLLAGINNNATDMTAEERTGITATSTTTNTTDGTTTNTAIAGSFEYKLNETFLGTDTGITALKDAFKALVDLDPTSSAAQEQLANMSGAATGNETLTKQVNAVKVAVERAALQQKITTETTNYNALTSKYSTEGLALKAKIDGFKNQLLGYTAANETETKMFALYDQGHSAFVAKQQAFANAETVLNNTNKSYADLVNYFFPGNSTAITSMKTYLSRLVSATYGSTTESANREELYALGEANTAQQPLINGLIDALKFRKLERQLIEYDKAYTSATAGSEAANTARSNFETTYNTFKALSSFNSTDPQVIQYQKLAKQLLDKSSGTILSRATADTSLWKIVPNA